MWAPVSGDCGPFWLVLGLDGFFCPRSLSLSLSLALSCPNHSPPCQAKSVFVLPSPVWSAVSNFIMNQPRGTVMVTWRLPGSL